MTTHGSLAGRVALVTGVSRSEGIAAAIARRLHERGAEVMATGWPRHDADMPWTSRLVGDDPTFPVEVHEHDLERPDVPAALIDEVVERHGAIHVVVATHARSSDVPLADVTATELDRCWAANVRSIVLLAQRFAARHVAAPADTTPSGRMIWFTSGQHLAPMPDEIGYTVSKGALHQMTRSIGASLAAARIIVNCINPGPVDTGWAPADVHAAVAARFPDQRWGTPGDVADVVEFLVSDPGAWIRGQVLDVEGGFDRFG